MAYEVLASAYDLLTGDVDYKSIASAIVDMLQINDVQSGIVLDLACGTGALSYLLAENGYEVIGVDSSAEMLAVAESKREAHASCYVQPIFVMQDMRKLDLYGTVDACICMLDSVNYITEPDDLIEVFRRVHLFMRPGGIFLFDINTPLLFEKIDGKTFCDEDEREGIFCVWSVAQTDHKNLYQYNIDLFSRESDSCSSEHWRRESEEQLEYAYSPEFLIEILKKAGFTNIRLSPSIIGAELTGEEHRIYISASKPGNISEEV